MKRIVSINSGNRSYSLIVENPLILKDLNVLLEKSYVSIPCELIDRGIKKEKEKKVRKSMYRVDDK